MNWIGLLVGAALGWLVGYIFRCQNGTCPITSHWWIPTIIGAIFGLTWPMAIRKEEPESIDELSGRQNDDP